MSPMYRFYSCAKRVLFGVFFVLRQSLVGLLFSPLLTWYITFQQTLIIFSFVLIFWATNANCLTHCKEFYLQVLKTSIMALMAKIVWCRKEREMENQSRGLKERCRATFNNKSANIQRKLYALLGLAKVFMVLALLSFHHRILIKLNSGIISTIELRHSIQK